MSKNMDKITEKALQLHNQGNNCCQSVCLAFADKLGIDEEVLFKISEGFGAGMGNLQGSCGALSAAVMIAGIYNSRGKDAAVRTKSKTYKLVSHINNEFIDLVGSMCCKEIKGRKPRERLSSAGRPVPRKTCLYPDPQLPRPGRHRLRLRPAAPAGPV